MKLLKEEGGGDAAAALPAEREKIEKERADGPARKEQEQKMKEKGFVRKTS